MGKPQIDRDAIRAGAEAAREVAKQQAAAARREAEEAKAALKKPVAKYVEMPAPTGDAETDSAADLDELQSGFRKRAADESARFALATDTEYWAALCFQTREQRDHFFAALKVRDIGIGGRFYDGCAVAKALGITLPSADVPYKPEPKPDPAWIEFLNRPVLGK